MSFLEKYKPQSLNDIVGNKRNIDKMKKWIKNFNNKDKEDKRRSILVSGNPSLGKTSCALLLLKHFNYDVIEFNASEVRTGKEIKKKLDNIIHNANISMMLNDKRDIGIIMDEIDGASTSDRGGLKELLNYVKIKKKSKKRLKNPIIFITNTEVKKDILQIKKYSLYIKFNYASNMEIINFIEKICKLENLNLEKEIIIKISKNSQKDFRRILLLLELLKRNEKNLTMERCNLLIDHFEKKEINYSIRNIIDKLLNNSKNIKFLDYLKLCSNDLSQIILLLHTNFPEYLLKNRIGDKDDKIADIISYLDYLILSSTFENKMYENNIWNFKEYINILGCYSAKIFLNKYERLPYQKHTQIDFKTSLNKLSVKNINLKTQNKICTLLEISLEEYPYIADIILSKIINNDVDILNYLKEKNITGLDIEKLIKLNINQEYWRKKINNEKIKELNKILN